MTKEKILDYFKDINHAYNDCTKYDTLKRMLDELQDPLADATKYFNTIYKLSQTLDVSYYFIDEKIKAMMSEENERKTECKYCKFINKDMPLQKDCGREVTEIRYSTKDNNLFYWGHLYRVPLNFCPNCGAKMEVQNERN